MTISTKPPMWHVIAAALLTAWNLVGCYFCWLQFRLGADWMPDATAYDRALMASLPVWYNWCYALAVGAGALGGAALLARHGAAVALLAVSLVAAVVQFGYLFATSDIIAHKGAGTTVPFPLFIIAVAALALWGAKRAQARGWVR